MEGHSGWRGFAQGVWSTGLPGWGDHGYLRKRLRSLLSCLQLWDCRLGAPHSEETVCR